MKRKGRPLPPQEPPRRPFIWLPAVILPAAALIEVLFSLREHDFPNRAFFVHNQTLVWMSRACWVLAGAALIAPLRLRLFRHLEGLSSAPAARRRLWPAAAALGFAGMACFIKVCQYRGFQLPFDASDLIHTAWAALHGRGLECVPEGSRNVLDVHFAFTGVLLSPLLLLWRSSLALILAQALAVGSLGLAAYFLARRLSGSSFAGFLAMLLAYSHPAFHQLASATLENSVFMAPFFLWGMVLWERGNRPWAALLLALAATTREQFPFTLAGLGLYRMFRDGRPTRDSMLKGGGLAAVAVLLWLAEIWVMGQFQHPDPSNPRGLGYWGMYSHFGATREEILRFVLGHPLLALSKAISPPSRLWPTLMMLFFAAFLPLSAPAAGLVFLVAALPQMLMACAGTHGFLLWPPVTDVGNHDYPLQNASYVFGPLLFASAHGLARLCRSIGGERKSWLLVPALAAAGLGFHRSVGKNLLRDWRPYLFDSGPQAVSRIPPDASVWSEEYLSTWLAPRLQLKHLTFPGEMRGEFRSLLFRPEHILIQKAWFIHAGRDGRDSIVLFLAQNRYEKVWDSSHLILLKDPSAPRGGRSPDLALPKAVPAHKAAIEDAARKVLARVSGTPGGIEPRPFPDGAPQEPGAYLEYLILGSPANP